MTICTICEKLSDEPLNERGNHDHCEERRTMIEIQEENKKILLLNEKLFEALYAAEMTIHAMATEAALWMSEKTRNQERKFQERMEEIRKITRKL